jgi:hypothetical protein
MSIDDDFIGMTVFSASDHTPAGWLLCNGSPYVRSDYPKLFAAIGTLYGTGEPADKTFRVPDMRGRVAVSVGGPDAELNHPIATPVGKPTAPTDAVSGPASSSQRMCGKNPPGDLEAPDAFDFTPPGHTHHISVAPSTIQPGLILRSLIKAK